MTEQTLAQTVQTLADKAALKELVDTFSNLADTKDVPTQMQLFTEDAVIDSTINGQPGMSLKGRKAIGDAFAGYLALFDTVYHINGQQTVEIHGDRATGIAYTTVTLIGTQNGERTRNTSGVRYQDEYVRQNGKWLIAHRTSNFTWQVIEPMPAAAAR